MVLSNTSQDRWIKNKWIFQYFYLTTGVTAQGHQAVLPPGMEPVDTDQRFYSHHRSDREMAIRVIITKTTCCHTLFVSYFVLFFLKIISGNITCFPVSYIRANARALVIVEMELRGQGCFVLPSILLNRLNPNRKWIFSPLWSTFGCTDPSVLHRRCVFCLSMQVVITDSVRGSYMHNMLMLVILMVVKYGSNCCRKVL